MKEISRIIQPIGDKIIIPKRKMWMGLEDRMPPRMLYPQLSKKGILTPGSSSGSAGPSGASCPADGSPDVVSPVTTPVGGIRVGYSSTWEAIGTKWTVPSTKVICKLGFQCLAAGDPDAINYRAVILLDADNTIVTNGVSDITPGTEMPDPYGWVYFDWTGNKPILTADTAYDFIVYRDDHGLNETNYIRLGNHDQQAGGFEDIHNFHWNVDHWEWQALLDDAFDVIMSVYYYD